MLDSYTVQASPAYPQTVNVNNAPAADQARLLHDLEKEAQGRIVARGNLDNTLINVSWRAYQIVEMRGHNVDVAFSLNGHDISFRFFEPSDEIDIQSIEDKTFKRLTDEIAQHLVIESHRQ